MKGRNDASTAGTSSATSETQRKVTRLERSVTAGTISSTRLPHAPSPPLPPRRGQSSGRVRGAGCAVFQQTPPRSTDPEASSSDKDTSPRPPPSHTIALSPRHRSSSLELLEAAPTPMASSSSASGTPLSSRLCRRGCPTVQRSSGGACSSSMAG